MCAIGVIFKLLFITQVKNKRLQKKYRKYEEEKVSFILFYQKWTKSDTLIMNLLMRVFSKQPSLQ